MGGGGKEGNSNPVGSWSIFPANSVSLGFWESTQEANVFQLQGLCQNLKTFVLQPGELDLKLCTLCKVYQKINRSHSWVPSLILKVLPSLVNSTLACLPNCPSWPAILSAMPFQGWRARITPSKSLYPQPRLLLNIRGTNERRVAFTQ